MSVLAATGSIFVLGTPESSGIAFPGVIPFGAASFSLLNENGSRSVLVEGKVNVSLNSRFRSIVS
ncbi:MAG: hypothetical protein KDA99_24810, partial [Planctomycetales bacterium]|nr:hypothetical protein [Planctomycetales bacterium]